MPKKSGGERDGSRTELQLAAAVMGLSPRDVLALADRSTRTNWKQLGVPAKVMVPYYRRRLSEAVGFTVRDAEIFDLYQEAVRGLQQAAGKENRGALRLVAELLRNLEGKS